MMLASWLLLLLLVKDGKVWRLLAVKQLRKNHLPAGKHHASEGRASSKKRAKKLPNVSSEILEKQHFSPDFRQILLPAAASRNNSFEKITSRQGNTMPLKDELVPKPRQKTP